MRCSPVGPDHGVSEALYLPPGGSAARRVHTVMVRANSPGWLQPEVG